MDYVLNNVRNITIAGALTYLWSLSGSPVGYTALMNLLRSLGITSSGVLYQVIKKLIREELVKEEKVGKYGTRIRYVPTRQLILELSLDCPWETDPPSCYGLIHWKYEDLLTRLGNDNQAVRKFIEWLLAITGIGSSEIENPLSVMRCPLYLWDAKSIKSYWASKEEYMKNLRETATFLRSKDSERILFKQFRNKYVMEYIDFLMWLGGGDVDDADLPARVVYCYDKYVRLFNDALTKTMILQFTSWGKDWLKRKDEKILKYLIKMERKKMRNEFKLRTKEVMRCLALRKTNTWQRQ